MRMSNWSSDVCAADHNARLAQGYRRAGHARDGGVQHRLAGGDDPVGLREGALFQRLQGGTAIRGERRSDERRVGKEMVGTRRSRWSQFYIKYIITLTIYISHAPSIHPTP